MRKNTKEYALSLLLINLNFCVDMRASLFRGETDDLIERAPDFWSWKWSK
jgi:hypothetical protein